MKQKHPIAAFREVVFHLQDASGAPLTGKTFATTDIQIRKPGASAYANADATQQTAVVEIGGGDYVYTCTTAELDTIGTGWSFKVNKTGAVEWVFVDTIERAAFATAQSGTLATSIVTTDRTEADKFWNDALLLAISGALAGQVKKIGSAANGGGYTLSGGTFGLANGQFWTAAPAVGDVFEIINR